MGIGRISGLFERWALVDSDGKAAVIKLWDLLEAVRREYPYAKSGMRVTMLQKDDKTGGETFEIVLPSIKDDKRKDRFSYSNRDFTRSISTREKGTIAVHKFTLHKNNHVSLRALVGCVNQMLVDHGFNVSALDLPPPPTPAVARLLTRVLSMRSPQNPAGSSPA